MKQKTFFRRGFVSSVLNLLSVTLAIAAAVYANQGLQKDIFVTTAISVAVYLIVERITDLFQQVKYDNALNLAFQSIDNSLTEQLNIVNSKLNIQEVGSRDRGNELVMQELRSANRVRNTYVSFGKPQPAAQRFEKRVSTIYSEFLQRNPSNVWQDLISYENIFNVRYMHQENISDYEGQLELRYLPTSIPIINFIILGDDMRFNKVFFGWRHVKDAQSERIYFSEDPNIVDLFNSYFSYLWTSPVVEEVTLTSVKQPRGKENIVVATDFDGGRRFGNWITFSIQGNRVKDVGFVKVSDENGRIKISGQVYGLDGRPLFSFMESDVLVKGSSMFFDYKTVSEAPDFSFCLYRFKRKEESKIDYLDGIIVDREDRPSRRILGVPTRGVNIKSINIEEKIKLLEKAIDEDINWSEQKTLPLT